MTGVTPTNVIGWREAEVNRTPFSGRIFPIHLFGRESLFTKFGPTPVSRMAVNGD